MAMLYQVAKDRIEGGGENWYSSSPTLPPGSHCVRGSVLAAGNGVREGAHFSSPPLFLPCSLGSFWIGGIYY